MDLSVEFEKVNNWLKTRSERERAALLIIAFLAIFFIWYLLFETPISYSRSGLNQQVASYQQKIRALTAQKAAIIADALQPANVALAMQDNVLRTELHAINEQLALYLQQSIPPSQMVVAIKTALSEASGLNLGRLENTPPLPPPPAPSIDNKQTPPKAATATNPTNNNSEKLYKHAIVFEFRGDYVSTVNYLQRMENIKWRFFWDGLNYKVINYPTGDITITVHTLSNQESLLNV